MARPIGSIASGPEGTTQSLLPLTTNTLAGIVWADSTSNNRSIGGLTATAVSTRGSTRAALSADPTKLHCNTQLRLREGWPTSSQRALSRLVVGRAPASCSAVVAPQEWPATSTAWVFTGRRKPSRPSAAASITADTSLGRKASSSGLGGGALPASIARCWLWSLPGWRGNTTV